MIYLDSCAMVKLLIEEPESNALDSHLAQQNHAGVHAISSQLSITEVHRALIRHGADETIHDEADAMLAAYATLPLEPILESAGRLPQPALRSLDALHLATARMLGPAVTQFITYDKRLVTAATELGLPVVTPGIG